MDEPWEAIEHHRLGQPGDPGRTGEDNRRFVNAVMWITKTGGP